MKVKNIFVPKDKIEILSDLLETDPRNVPYMIGMYNKFNPIFNTKAIDHDKLNYFYEWVFNSKFPDERSAGILGLKRCLRRWKDGFYIDDSITYEIIFDYFKFINNAKTEYKKWFKDKFESHGLVNESITNMLKPKSIEDITKDIENLSISDLVDNIQKIIKYCVKTPKMTERFVKEISPNMPLIIQIFLESEMMASYVINILSYETTEFTNGYAQVYLRYKTTSAIIRQYDDENFIIFVNPGGIPLWDTKIYDIKTFMKVMEEKEKGEF